jgi:uncharacterized membrane protein
VLGVALGGFFDGILLHQVLQWHHLLSLVPGEDLRRIETQILADGAFHVLMWLVAVAGLWLLWRARDDLARDRSGRALGAAVLLGFAAWNAVDVIGFHWILHIHRIRVDVPAADRLGWDLGWLALFAAVPLAAAWFTARGGSGGPAPRGAAVALALLVVGAAALSLRAPPDADARTVLFRAGSSQADILAAAGAVGGAVVAMPSNRLAVLTLPKGEAGWRLYRHGALVVGGPGSPAACLNWTTVPG